MKNNFLRFLISITLVLIFITMSSDAVFADLIDPNFVPKVCPLGHIMVTCKTSIGDRVGDCSKYQSNPNYYEIQARGVSFTTHTFCYTGIPVWILIPITTVSLGVIVFWVLFKHKK
jgi:hypothetical protein